MPKPPDKKTKTLTIMIGGGTVEVQGFLVSKTDGVLAVTTHPQEHPGWGITHIASGLAIGGYFDSEVRASLIAQELWRRLTEEEKEICKRNKPISCRSWSGVKWYQEQLNRYGMQ